jgi:hypothetical protein
MLLLAKAAACNEASIVPIIEPEVLLDGNHSAERSEEVQRGDAARLLMPRLPPITSSRNTSSSRRACASPAKNNPAPRPSVDEVAGAHRAGSQVGPFRPQQPGRRLPCRADQSDGKRHRAPELRMVSMKGLPWPLTFSTRARCRTRRSVWRGLPGNVAAAQKALSCHLRANDGLAAQGKWRAELEKSGRPEWRCTSPRSRACPRIGKGKVRDIYAVGNDKMLIVTSDRLSAFDVVLSDPIPDKGRVLNEMANFWFASSATSCRIS